MANILVRSPRLETITVPSAMNSVELQLSVDGSLVYNILKNGSEGTVLVYDIGELVRDYISQTFTSGAYSTDTADAAATTTFKLIRANNVTSIESTAKGTYKVKFPSDVYATGDVVYVSGKAIDDDDHTFTPIAGVLNDANGVTNNTVTTTNDVQEVIVSIYSKFGQNVAQSTLHNGSYIELAFY